jgi:CDP-6-deoxy-D-xylo-4-hexulose-3-dehydrase
VRQPFYKIHGVVHGELPGANLIHEHGIYFGNNPELTDLDIKTLIDIFTGFKV